MSVSEHLNDLLNLYIFPRGRREYALKEVGRLAREQEHAALAEHCDAAVAHAQRTREQERGLKAAKALGANPRLLELDNQADRTLTAIHTIPEQTARAMGGDTAKAVEEFLSQAFPEGVAAVTGQPWPEQLADTQALLRVFDGELRGDVERFGLTSLVELLRQLSQEIETELGNASPADITAKEIRVRDAAGQDLLLEAVAMVIGLYPKTTKAHTRARAVLLNPIITQSEQLRLSRARRQPPEDVNPSTGEVLTPPQGGQTEDDSTESDLT